MSNNKGWLFVRDIEGDFFVPSYQRGYRWGKDEVERLLNDIYENGPNPYCLQPIVVKLQSDGKFELIDGQQRLTTIYLIYKYLHSEFPRIQEAKFTIDYQTRKNSREYLINLDESRKEEYIDFWHIWQAYSTVKNWFDKKDFAEVTEINRYLTKYVKIIWYEVERDENSEKLFSRLNIGKIPLTSAELVKAMFLSSANSKMTNEKQDEIALQWDNIERELNDGSFWNFLTGRTDYFTRIDLVLDLMSGKPSECREKYFTFNEFYKCRKAIEKENETIKREKDKRSVVEIWNEINRTFLILKDWYEERELYHKIGYLIASGYKSLKDIYDLANRRNGQEDIFDLLNKNSEGMTKSQFKCELDGLIRKSVKIDKNYGELSYQKPNDYKKISRLLLLFNVVSVDKLGNGQRFPFDKFKSTVGGAWSLEHIHAQNSEGLKTVKEWHEWLRLQLPYVVRLAPDETQLIETMKKQIDNEKLDKDDFEKTQAVVFEKLSRKPAETKHTISNLALLRTDANAALNNSTFAVKHGKIIEMDRQGKFIPYCTKMVFLKYYNDSDDNSLYFWDDGDRKTYITKMNETLKDYLEEEIDWNVEENDGE